MNLKLEGFCRFIAISKAVTIFWQILVYERNGFWMQKMAAWVLPDCVAAVPHIQMS